MLIGCSYFLIKQTTLSDNLLFFIECMGIFILHIKHLEELSINNRLQVRMMSDLSEILITENSFDSQKAFCVIKD